MAEILPLIVVLVAVLTNVCTSRIVKTSFDNELTDDSGDQLPQDDARKAVTFSLAKHFSSHMVLQKAPAKANIHGFSSDVGAKVSVTMVVSGGKTFNYQTTVKQGLSGQSAEWIVTLDPITAGTTVTITVVSGAFNTTLIDVIFGDVWLCSGQSNMEFTVSMLEDNGNAEMADAHNYPNIRLMTVNNNPSASPLQDVINVRQAWTRASNASVGGPHWNFFSAVCWFYGKAIHKALGYPIGLLDTDWGGTPAEAWSSPAALAKCGVHTPEKRSESSISSTDQLSLSKRQVTVNQNNNSALWNAMIHPLLKMTIFGAIWYQGESDASGVRMNTYNCTFRAMINDWRDNFHSASGGQTNATFPFGFVQLAAYNPNPNTVGGFPEIRWHQTADYGYVPNPKLVNVFMAVAIDLPGFNSTYGAVHPQDKLDVGNRLSLSGLAVAYGKTEVFQGPFPQKIETTAQGMMIVYGTKWNLEIRNKTGFELQCNHNNNKWVATEIIANDKTSVTLKVDVCPQGQSVSGVRYEWRESPCLFKKCAVYETVNGLPAPPFVFTDTDMP